MGMTDAEKARIKKEIFDFLDTNGDMTRREIVERLSPACSPSKIDSNLSEWRIKNGIATRKFKPQSDKPVVQDVAPIKSDNVTVEPIRTGEQIDFMPVESKPTPQVEKSVVEPISLDGEMHNFSCSVKIPLETYKRFKLASAYRGDKIRELLARWMSEYVREDPAVLKAVSALDD